MRVLIFVPRVHFFAPLVLRRLFEEHPDLEYRLITTPKINRDRSFLAGLAALVNQQGLAYVASQATLRLVYGFRGLAEHWSGRPIHERRAIAVEETARAHGVDVVGMRSIRSQKTRARIQRRTPDYLVSVFFNQLIPESILNLPARGAVNLHPGRLPAYRGSSPVFWQLYNEEPRAGCALHRLTEELDAGPVFRQRSVSIQPTESYYSLYTRLARRGGDLLVSFFDRVRSGGSISFTEQDARGATTYSRFGVSEVREFYRRGERFWKWSDLV